VPASGCVAGHAVHVVHVQTGFAPSPHSHTTFPYVHVPSPAAHWAWLFGALDGQFAPLPPLLLLPELLPESVSPPPLPEPLPPPDPLPLAEPLDDAAPLLLPLLPVEPPLLPPLLLVLASEPLFPGLLLPPHAGTTSATTPTVAEITTAILRARMEVPPRKERPF
jgi:hypothetical protein